MFGEFALSLDESQLQLYPVPCTSGMEPNCILDPDHPCCENIERKTVEFKDGILIKQGNSAIVSLKLTCSLFHPPSNVIKVAYLCVY